MLRVVQDLGQKPRELRGWLQTIAERLTQNQQGRDDQATHYDDSRVRGDVASIRQPWPVSAGD